jgi:hypothetical protein
LRTRALWILVRVLISAVASVPLAIVWGDHFYQTPGMILAKLIVRPKPTGGWLPGVADRVALSLEIDSAICFVLLYVVLWWIATWWRNRDLQPDVGRRGIEPDATGQR